MSLIAIVAISDNYAIGKDGTLPWHHPEDLRFFRDTTIGNTVVMGYNTWLSIGKPLPKRRNIVLSSNRTVDEFPEVTVMRTREEVIRYANESETDTYIIGGAKAYSLFADDIEKWYVTRIPETITDADSFLDKGFLQGFSMKGEIHLSDSIKVEIFERDQ